LEAVAVNPEMSEPLMAADLANAELPSWYATAVEPVPEVAVVAYRLLAWTVVAVPLPIAIVRAPEVAPVATSEVFAATAPI
jgi:hypothetical protein